MTFLVSIQGKGYRKAPPLLTGWRAYYENPETLAVPLYIIYEVFRLYLQDIGYGYRSLEVHHVLAPVAILVDLEPVGGKPGPSLKLCASNARYGSQFSQPHFLPSM